MRRTADGLGRIARLGQQTSGTLVQVMARAGQAHWANRTINQLHTEGVFEMTD
jgi:hypothetical protein